MKILSPDKTMLFLAVLLTTALTAPAFAEDIKSQFPDIGGSAGGAINRGGVNFNSFSPNNLSPNNFNPGSFNPANFNPGNFQAGNFNPASASSDADNQALLRRINFDPRMMTKPDKFADNPSIDAGGGRHFGNGRHYDLATTSVQSAVGQLNAADEQIIQQAMQRQQRRQNRGRVPF